MKTITTSFTSNSSKGLGSFFWTMTYLQWNCFFFAQNGQKKIVSKKTDWPPSDIFSSGKDDVLVVPSWAWILSQLLAMPECELMVSWDSDNCFKYLVMSVWLWLLPVLYRIVSEKCLKYEMTNSTFKSINIKVPNHGRRTHSGPPFGYPYLVSLRCHIVEYAMEMERENLYI